MTGNTSSIIIFFIIIIILLLLIIIIMFSKRRFLRSNHFYFILCLTKNGSLISRSQTNTTGYLWRSAVPITGCRWVLPTPEWTMLSKSTPRIRPETKNFPVGLGRRWWVFPHFTPQNGHSLVGKPIVVGESHHFRKHPNWGKEQNIWSSKLSTWKWKYHKFVPPRTCYHIFPLKMVSMRCLFCSDWLQK